jgi:hypothetical protein
MYTLFLEQKEKIVQLERALRIREEENSRLLFEIKSLKESSMIEPLASQAVQAHILTGLSVDGPENSSETREVCDFLENVVNLDECGTSES